METASQDEEDKQEEETDEVDGDGRRRRKRKVPKRCYILHESCIMIIVSVVTLDVLA